MLSKLFRSVVILLFTVILTSVVAAQGREQPSLFGITVEGAVEKIDVNVITVGGMTIELASNDPILATLKVGDVVEVDGNISQETDVLVILADTVVLTNTTVVAPIITLNGPVDAVNLNIVTIFGIKIQFNPNDPILVDLNVGDVINVSGNIIITGGTIIIIPVDVVIIIDNPEVDLTTTPQLTVVPGSTPQPTVVSDEDDDDTIIVIEGPVEKININIITIYNIDIRIDPKDPILVGLKVGDNLRVEGNLVYEGNVIIIVAVRVVIVNVIIIDNGPTIPGGCKITGKGNGRIRCKGSRGSKKS